MLRDKVVIVTGSGQGIGKHAAKTFAQEKAKVVIADFNEDLAKKQPPSLAQQAKPSRCMSTFATKRA